MSKTHWYFIGAALATFAYVEYSASGYTTPGISSLYNIGYNVASGNGFSTTLAS